MASNYPGISMLGAFGEVAEYGDKIRRRGIEAQAMRELRGFDSRPHHKSIKR